MTSSLRSITIYMKYGCRWPISVYNVYFNCSTRGCLYAFSITENIFYSFFVCSAVLLLLSLDREMTTCETVYSFFTALHLSFKLEFIMHKFQKCQIISSVLRLMIRCMTTFLGQSYDLRQVCKNVCFV